MKSIILTGISFLLLIIEIPAQQVTLKEAEKAARKFYFERISYQNNLKSNDIGIVNYYFEGEPENPAYYIFNVHPKGYVVVSGTRNAIPVPAYSLNTSYSDIGQPPAFMAWMKQYHRQLDFAIQHKVVPYSEATSAWTRLLSDDPSDLLYLKNEKEVLPMLISTWDQGQFYNQMCPADPAGPGGHCVTGCVATAMGQLCYYFRWPISGTGSYTYEHPVYGTISADFGDTEYQWNTMTNTVQQQNNAVAELLFHLGASVDMDYGPDGSGMWNHKAAYSLRTFFKYSPETQYLYRDSTNLDWDSVIVAHLDQKIPMYYAGWSVPNLNGHAFIVDGYQTMDYFHFNWGWGGSYDGYFYLDNLVPGGSNFNLAQELVIHCYPDTMNYTYPYYCSADDTLRSLRGTIEDGSSPTGDYQNLANCSWLISPQTEEDSVSYIILNFSRIDTELNHDFVSLYDGPSTSDPILGQYSGSALPGTIYSTGNKVLVSFQSDDEETAAGWFLNYRSIVPVWCGGLTQLDGSEDYLSDGSGSFHYQNGSACMWNIQPPGATQVTIGFSEFDTEDQKDLVKIYDAASSQLLATYSGTYESGSLPDPVTSTSGKMFITFSSNQTITKQGWSAHYVSDAVTSIHSNNHAETIKVYPNPVKDFFYIELNLDAEQSVIMEITGLNGKLISKEPISCKGMKWVQKINGSELEPGIYLVRVVSREMVKNFKIIKME